MATKDRIIVALGTTQKTTKELIAVVGGSYASVHTSLRRLSRAGTVVEITEENGFKLKDTKWVLATVQTAPTPPARRPRPTATPINPNPPAPAKTRRTKAIVLVDVSGSMYSYVEDLARGLNRTLADLRSEAFRTGERTDVSLYYFDDKVRGGGFLNVDARDVKSEPQKVAGGGTALFDTVTRAINDHLTPERADEDVAYLLIVQTDGQDEHSHDRYGDRMKDLVRSVQGTDRWTITFQLPPGHKDQFCAKYSIHPGNCVEWERTRQGFEQATTQRSVATQTYFTNRTLGQNSTKAFYATVDLDKLKVGTVKSQLDDILGQVKTFQVPGETDIKEFIQERTGAPYRRGSVFYQLTKTEKVQPDKSLLVKEKGKRSIYAGDQARNLLGLPAGVDCKVKPGNLSNYDVFIQSKSVNRKLVRGTTIVLWPSAAL